MLDASEISHVVEKAIEGSDLFLVRVDVSRDNVVTVDLDSEQGVTIDQCVAVNNAVRAAFDREAEDYELTVGSYGITSPLLVRRQYDMAVGREVETLTRDGRKLRGTLTAADDQGVTIEMPTKVRPEGKKRPIITPVPHTLAYEQIKQMTRVIEI